MRRTLWVIAIVFCTVLPRTLTFAQNPPPGEACAAYDPATGDVAFAIHGSVALLGIGFIEDTLNSIDPPPALGELPPAQYDSKVLAWFEGGGLPNGTFVFEGLLPENLAIRENYRILYTPPGHPTVEIHFALPSFAAGPSPLTEFTCHAVPEPSSLFLMLEVAAIGMLQIRRRKRVPASFGQDDC